MLRKAKGYEDSECQKHPFCRLFSFTSIIDRLWLYGTVEIIHFSPKVSEEMVNLGFVKVSSFLCALRKAVGSEGSSQTDVHPFLYFFVNQKKFSAALENQS